MEVTLVIKQDTMKNFFAITTVALAFVAIAATKTVGAITRSIPEADSSFIYIYRGGQFAGSLTNFAIWVDDQKLCKISNGRYFSVPVKLGAHTISAKRGGVVIVIKE